MSRDSQETRGKPALAAWPLALRSFRRWQAELARPAELATSSNHRAQHGAWKDTHSCCTATRVPRQTRIALSESHSAASTAPAGTPRLSPADAAARQLTLAGPKTLAHAYAAMANAVFSYVPSYVAFK
jgi:hypothetical protein